MVCIAAISDDVCSDPGGNDQEPAGISDPYDAPAPEGADKSLGGFTDSSPCTFAPPKRHTFKNKFSRTVLKSW